MTQEQQPTQHELLITAYLDGELEGEDKVLFEKLQAEDKVFQTLLAKRQQQHNVIKAALHQSDANQVSDNVMDLLTAKTGNDPFLAKPSPGFQPWAMAASFAVVAILVAFFWRSSESRQGELLVAIEQSLNKQRSGQVVEVNPDNRLYINLSFVDHQGRYCREYYLQRSEQGALQRIACIDQGGWQTAVEASATWAFDAEQFKPASGAEPAAIAAFLDSNMASDSLSPEQETQAIALGWQQNP